MNISEQVRLWQQCRNTSPLLCSMDPDHPPLEWRMVDTGKQRRQGFLMCPNEECGFIRYDINPQILKMVHRPRHHGCYFP